MTRIGLNVDDKDCKIVIDKKLTNPYNLILFSIKFREEKSTTSTVTNLFKGEARANANTNDKQRK